MRKKYFPGILSKLLFIFTIITCSTLKNLAQGKYAQFPIVGFDIEKVKSDYNKEMAEIPSIKMKHRDKREKTLKRRLRWEEAYTVETLEGKKLIIPFSMDEELFLYDRYGNRMSYSSATMFIVSKKVNKHDFELVNYITDDPEDPSKHTTNWSGQIIIENVKGDFEKAYFVDNGIAISEEHSQVEDLLQSNPDCPKIEYWSCSYTPPARYHSPCQLTYTELICYHRLPTVKVKADNVYIQLCCVVSGTNKE